MARAQLKHAFAVSADSLWAMIGDFGDVGKWSGRPPEACRHEGSGIGSLRSLTLDGGGQIVDRLDAEGPRSYTYSIVASPLPVIAYTATMAVTSLGTDRCELDWHGTIEPDGISDAQAAEMFEGFYRYGVGLMEKQIARRDAST